jgi:hypothetical protein
MMTKKSRNSKNRVANRGRTANQSLVTAIKELNLVTRNFALPSRRDVAEIRTRKNQVYTFTRTQAGPDVYVQNAINPLGYSFNLSQLPSSSDFTALFDKYRITQIKYNFIPTVSVPNPDEAEGAFTDFPYIQSVIDYDDATTPATQNELRQFDTHQVNPLGTTFTRVIQPRAALASYSGAFTSFGQAPRSMWFDCSSPGVQYYGLKFCVSAAANSGTPYTAWHTEIEYTIQFMNAR